MADWKAHLRYNFENDTLEFAARTDRDHNGICMALHIQEAAFAPAALVPVYTTRDRHLFQAILDALWSHGMRPSGYVGTEQVAAIKDHLTDMRAINEKLLAKVLR